MIVEEKRGCAAVEKLAARPLCCTIILTSCIYRFLSVRILCRSVDNKRVEMRIARRMRNYIRRGLIELTSKILIERM